MAPEEAARVFERFFRGDPSRSRASGGTGLGLSIAAAIVQSHGGTIEASSSPGEGATFRITLPLAGPEPVSDHAEAPAPDEADAPTRERTEPEGEPARPGA